MRKIFSVILAVLLCVCLCGCGEKNFFEGDSMQLFSVGNVSFSIPKSAADDYNTLWDKIQIFNVENVGKITVMQFADGEDEYSTFEERYDTYKIIADSLDDFEFISSLNGKTLDKGLKKITVSSNDDSTSGSLWAFADGYLYSISMEASNDVFSKKNFNDFLATVKIK